MMTLDEMKRAVCGKLPTRIEFVNGDAFWNDFDCSGFTISKVVFWPTEGLQVCHEAEKLLSRTEWGDYCFWLTEVIDIKQPVTHAPQTSEERFFTLHATHEQRLESLCRVWWPERFQSGDPDAIDRAEYRHGRTGE